MSARRRAHFSATLSNNSQLGLVSREDSEKKTLKLHPTLHNRKYHHRVIRAREVKKRRPYEFYTDTIIQLLAELLRNKTAQYRCF